MQSYRELFGMSGTFKVVNALGGNVIFSYVLGKDIFCEHDSFNYFCSICLTPVLLCCHFIFPHNKYTGPNVNRENKQNRFQRFRVNSFIPILLWVLLLQLTFV